MQFYTCCLFILQIVRATHVQFNKSGLYSFKLFIYKSNTGKQASNDNDNSSVG